jgi:predicted DCC family thiol-disulfide oxidoreductase YuxK
MTPSMATDISHASVISWRHAGSAVLLFDDKCIVCLRFVSFVVGIDRRGALRVAPLESRFGDELRRAHSEFSKQDSALFVRPDGTVLAYSDAVLAALESIGGVWRHIARALFRIPRTLRDRAYTAFANHRYLFAGLGRSHLDPASSSRRLQDDEPRGPVDV